MAHTLPVQQSIGGTHSYGWFSDIEAEPEILYLEYNHDIEKGVYKVRNIHVPVKHPTFEISLTGEILSEHISTHTAHVGVNSRTLFPNICAIPIQNKPPAAIPQKGCVSVPITKQSQHGDLTPETYTYAVPYAMFSQIPATLYIHPTRNNESSYTHPVHQPLPRRNETWYRRIYSYIRYYNTCIHFILYLITACAWYFMLSG